MNSRHEIGSTMIDLNAGELCIAPFFSLLMQDEVAPEQSLDHSEGEKKGPVARQWGQALPEARDIMSRIIRECNIDVTDTLPGIEGIDLAVLEFYQVKPDTRRAFIGVNSDTEWFFQMERGVNIVSVDGDTVRDTAYLILLIKEHLC